MIEFEILKEVTLAINQDREKKKAEKIKEWKARANNVSEYLMRTTETMEKNYHSITGVNRGERSTL